MIVALAVTPPAFFLATGLLIGMWVRKGVVSGVLNIGLVLTLWIGLPVMILIGMDLIRLDSRTEDRLAMVLHATSPLGLMGTIIDNDVTTDSRPVNGRFDLGDEDVTRGTMLAVVAAHAGAQLALTGLALALARRLFTRASGRSS